MNEADDYLARKAAKLDQRYKALRHVHAQLAGRNHDLRHAHAALEGRCERLRHEAEQQRRALQEIQQSRGWRLLCRARRFKESLLPPHSRRGRLARRAWQRLRNLLRFFSSRRSGAPVAPPAVPGDAAPVAAAPDPPAATPAGPPAHRTDGASVPTPRKFRVVFLVATGAYDAAAMRYRGHNVIEALALLDVEAEYVADEDVAARLAHILSFDLIVLVRRQHTERIAAVLDAARAAGVPVVYDIDDYVFDPWLLPYVEGYHRYLPAAEALQLIGRLRACLDRCDYFTGSTPYLIEQAAALNKTCFRIRNGLNAAQLQLSEAARRRGPDSARDGRVRLGYFSGSRTHLGDFRVAYPALVRLMREFPDLGLVVVGALDLDYFPGLACFGERIETRPFLDWRELPAEIARVDVNLIPLELNPFTEGKSDLKYYEAGVLKIPTVASPTRVLRESITHGRNGFLADTADEWYDALRPLVRDGGLRREVGENACAHVMRHYLPHDVAREAARAYREIIRLHRARRGIGADALSVVFILDEPDGRSAAHDVVLFLAEELVRLGNAVTVFVPESPRFHSAAALEEYIAGTFFEPLFSVQLGGEVPCCDVLIAADHRSARRAKAHERRAARLVYLAQDRATAAEHAEAFEGLTVAAEAVRGGGRLPGADSAGRALQEILRQALPADGSPGPEFTEEYRDVA